MERLGGAEAREIGRCYWAGEATDEIREAYARICIPLYSQRAGDPDAERMHQIRRNYDVLEHFRHNLVDRFGEVTCPGMRILVVTIAMPSDLKTASNARLYLLSRSLIRCLTVVLASCRSMMRFRAIWVVHSAVGWGGDTENAARMLDDREDVVGHAVERGRD